MLATPTPPMPHGRLQAARGITWLGRHRSDAALPAHGPNEWHGAQHPRATLARVRTAGPGHPCR
eukprot:6171214-Lingulodinium_polyedra.AAC.1